MWARLSSSLSSIPDRGKRDGVVSERRYSNKSLPPSSGCEWSSSVGNERANEPTLTSALALFPRSPRGWKVGETCSFSAPSIGACLSGPFFDQAFVITIRKDWYRILYLCNRNLSISRFYITIWMRDTFQFFSTKVQLLIQELLG